MENTEGLRVLAMYERYKNGGIKFSQFIFEYYLRVLGLHFMKIIPYLFIGFIISFFVEMQWGIYISFYLFPVFIKHFFYKTFLIYSSPTGVYLRAFMKYEEGKIVI
ncbi:hypothetical protein [Flammeovirga aprica]|uniref:Uncharacterized protein n=1 Tax=Flammeovirga aprica JL-4 TaxID=694437 RepID=A0A7X9XBF6_9BACT|nr:hypothetical protein [Flammeovirga aprica]NME70574.1 hypothetical protein [Flammeovirga aprica JL-4]